MSAVERDVASEASLYTAVASGMVLVGWRFVLESCSLQMPDQATELHGMTGITASSNQIALPSVFLYSMPNYMLT